jgi:hypothetical protein
MIRRLRFILGYRRAATLERGLAAQAAQAALAAELEARRARVADSVARLDHSAEVLRRDLLEAYRDRDEHGPNPTLDAVIADAELALLNLATDPPASRRKDPHGPRQE